MKKFIIHVFSPLLLGLIIYFLFRKTSGLLFSEYMGLNWTNKIAFSAPNFIKYNLPDGLWSYASTNAIIQIWKHELSKNSIFWICLIPFMGITTEILQAQQLFMGTYDSMDLVAYLIAFIASLKQCKIKISSFIKLLKII
jgi:hypothetical protein